MRVISLDSSNKVTDVKFVGNNYLLQDNEFVSDVGELGQIRQVDGTFINSETPVTQPTIEEQILAENQYQTALLEISLMD